MKTILDVSNIVYSGGTERRLRGFPVGGIRKLLGLINAGIRTGEFVLCFDGGKILKKELLPTYKAGRVPDFSVMAQIDLLKEILYDCNIPFYFDPEYEADDWVYSFCYTLACVGSKDRVVIQSDDRDLACCVTSLVTQKGVTENGRTINRESFESRVVNGKRIPYNTLLIWKLFHGDSSDNYPALKIPGLYFESVANKLVEKVKPLIDQGLPEMLYCDKEIVDGVLKECLEGHPDSVKQKVFDQLRIVFPYLLDVADCDIDEYIAELEKHPPFEVELKHLKLCSNSNVNWKRFEFYCGAFGLNKVNGRYFNKDSPEALQFYQLLELKAKELSQGVIAVERYSQRPRVEPQGETLANMALPI